MSKDRVKFEIKSFYDQDGFTNKGIFIDGNHFDWGVDEDGFREAMSMGPQFVQTFEREIHQHFLDSLSEFMNRKVTTQEVNLAQKTGWIEK